MGNQIVGHDADARHSFAENIAMKLEDQLRGVIRRKHYSFKTEESYAGWYKRYVRWAEMRHPQELGAAEVTEFLTHLAVERRLSAVTQTQALNARVFFPGRRARWSFGAGRLRASAVRPAPF